MVSSLFLLFEIVKELKNQKLQHKIKYQELETKTLKAKVAALSAQMNPHLLFNSLNTIAATIPSNPDSAEEMTVQLSELYRGVLKSSKGEMHTLAEEIDLCQSYLVIEKNRFGKRIDYTFDIDTTINTNKIFIPVLLLQPLVENSIKHGLSPLKLGGKICIKITKDDENLLITIADNGAGNKNLCSNNNGTGTALKNCESRIKIRYSSQAQFQFDLLENGAKTKISLPYNEVYCD